MSLQQVVVCAVNKAPVELFMQMQSLGCRTQPQEAKVLPTKEARKMNAVERILTE
jgi:hypothetical protein